MAKNNMILLTVTKEGGYPVTSFQELLDPDKMYNIRASGVNVAFDYKSIDKQNPAGFVLRALETNSLTLAQLQGVVNSNSPQGKTTLIGVIDAGATLAAGTYNIKDVNGNDLVLPANTRVFDGYMETVTTFTGATATIALGYTPDGTTTAVLGTTTATTLTSGTKTALTPVGTAASATAKTTAARNIILTVATATVTAGKAYVFIDIVTTGL